MKCATSSGETEEKVEFGRRHATAGPVRRGDVAATREAWVRGLVRLSERSKAAAAGREEAMARDTSWSLVGGVLRIDPEAKRMMTKQDSAMELWS